MQTACALDIDEPIFQPFPPEVIFHHFEAFSTHEVLLYLRNNDKVGPQPAPMQCLHSHREVAEPRGLPCSSATACTSWSIQPLYS